MQWEGEGVKKHKRRKISVFLQSRHCWQCRTEAFQGLQDALGWCNLALRIPRADSATGDWQQPISLRSQGSARQRSPHSWRLILGSTALPGMGAVPRGLAAWDPTRQCLGCFQSGWAATSLTVAVLCPPGEFPFKLCWLIQTCPPFPKKELTLSFQNSKHLETPVNPDAGTCSVLGCTPWCQRKCPVVG